MPTDIRDIKAPVEIPLAWWILIFILVLTIAGAVYFFYRRRRRPAVPKRIPVPVRLPWEIALERLEDLHHKHYPRAGLFKLFYSELSDIVRHYLEDRFRIKAPEMTTEEFLSDVKTSPALKEEDKESLKNFLNGSDMVKFAKYTPTVNDAQANFDLAKKLILGTKDGV